MAFISTAPPPRRTRRVLVCSPRMCASPEPLPDDVPEPSADWRAFRARLIQQQRSQATAPDLSPTSFAHVLSVPESGAVLLANPAYFAQSQTYFHRAAILLFAHHPSAGTAGLLLNRPASAVPPPLPKPPAPFESTEVKLGGDVGEGSLFALYPTPGIGVSKHPVVMPGLSMLADIRDAVQAVRQGDIADQDVRLYTRYCGWAPGQLALEVERGVWSVTAVSSDFVLNLDSDQLYDRLIAELGLDAEDTLK